MNPPSTSPEFIELDNRNAIELTIDAQSDSANDSMRNSTLSHQTTKEFANSGDLTKTEPPHQAEIELIESTQLEFALQTEMIELDPEEDTHENHLSTHTLSFAEKFWLQFEPLLKVIPFQTLSKFLPPTMVALIVGYILALIPFSKHAFNDKNSILYKLGTEVIVSIGQPTVVCSLFILVLSQIKQIIELDFQRFDLNSKSTKHFHV